MNPNHLKSEELNYEISIRGVDPPATVDEKRIIMRGLVAQESINRSFNEVDVNIPIEFSNQPNYLKIASRLMHISGRIFRMKVTQGNVEEEATQRNVRSQLITLEAELAEIVETSNHRSNPPHSTPIASGSVPSNLTYLKKIPVYKWGIKKFSGQGSLIAFLELIDSLRISRGCSESDSFDSASDLFESHV
ncbi:hypothetical protein HHI36_024271 [Cryptolaemus montrouzieri]|uniref:Uncharacterized protein n=1 Tax=Cryptolaemus montrouzieri TaxID=559131 RepID=A0ABD2NZF1_9CUCU